MRGRAILDTLRHLARSGQLEEIASAMRRLLTLRSVSDLTLALQAGKLVY